MDEDIKKDVKVKPKPSLVRLNGSPSPVMVGDRLIPGQKMSKLCTFKAPRDLTLGAANAKTPDKKKFVPNLNVVRNVKKEDNVDRQTSNGHAKNQRKRDHSAKKEKKDRKEKPQLIQTTGSVFAEGVGSDAVGGARSRSGAASGGGGGRIRAGEEGGGGLAGALGLSSEQEEARIRELMRDDFIDDLKSGDRTPVQLPMIDTGESMND